MKTSGSMQTIITVIAQKHGLDLEADNTCLQLENKPYMPLLIEKDAMPLPSAPRQSSRQPQSAPRLDNFHEGVTTAHIQYNLNRLNFYRARAGVTPLKLDDELSAFAHAGSMELMRNHIPHNHFSRSNVWEHGFKGQAAENQGDPNGWFPGPTPKVINDILKSMMDEGPGGGHHDAIINPTFRRVGIGLVKDSRGRLYLTNDFSE